MMMFDIDGDGWEQNKGSKDNHGSLVDDGSRRRGTAVARVVVAITVGSRGWQQR